MLVSRKFFFVISIYKMISALKIFILNKRIKNRYCAGILFLFPFNCVTLKKPTGSMVPVSESGMPVTNGSYENVMFGTRIPTPHGFENL
jgi:hypothetical protein